MMGKRLSFMRRLIWVHTLRSLYGKLRKASYVAVAVFGTDDSFYVQVTKSVAIDLAKRAGDQLRYSYREGSTELYINRNDVRGQAREY
jgi:hypothetical protein